MGGTVPTCQSCVSAHLPNLPDAAPCRRTDVTSPIRVVRAWCGHNESWADALPMCYGVLRQRLRRSKKKSALEKLRHIAKLSVAGVEQILNRLIAERDQLMVQHGIQHFCSRLVIAVRAAFRLGNDFIHD